MSNSTRFNPIILNYKTFSLFVQEKDNTICIETNSKHIIHTSYNPKSEKGHHLNVKINFGSSERITSKEVGLNLHYSLSNDLDWYISCYENENGLSIDIITGQHMVTIENTTKIISNIKQYSLLVKIIQTE